MPSDTKQPSIQFSIWLMSPVRAKESEMQKKDAALRRVDLVVSKVV